MDVPAFHFLYVWRGPNGKLFFVHGKSLKSMVWMNGFTYVFEDGEKCNGQWMCVFFSFVLNVWQCLNGKWFVWKRSVVWNVAQNDWFYKCFWTWLKMRWSVDVWCFFMFGEVSMESELFCEWSRRWKVMKKWLVLHMFLNIMFLNIIKCVLNEFHRV